jgi:solute carrier family 25 oxoglutarate transporter 11
MPDLFTTCKPFLIGGVAGMTSTAIIQPIDVVKTTLQLRGGITVGEAVNRTYVRGGGVGGFYRGLSAALLRQSVYTTMRVGLFPVFVGIVPNAEKRLLPKMGCGIMAGGIAAFISTPTDLVLTRMQSDNTSMNEVKYRYKHVFDGLWRIGRKDGVSALWRGGGVIVPRAMVINGVLLPGYHQSKQMLIARGHDEDSIVVRAVPPLVAGVLSATVSQPFDIIRAHIQANPTVGGVGVLRTVGVGRLFRGFPVYMARIVPHGAITTFLVDAMWRMCPALNRNTT